MKLLISVGRKRDGSKEGRRQGKISGLKIHAGKKSVLKLYFSKEEMEKIKRNEG